MIDEDVKKLSQAARQAIHDFDMFHGGHYSEVTLAASIDRLSVALVKVEDKIEGKDTNEIS